jgi:hypothetical protein
MNYVNLLLVGIFTISVGHASISRNLADYSYEDIKEFSQLGPMHLLIRDICASTSDRRL